MNTSAQSSWAATTIHLWPELYTLTSLDVRLLPDAAQLMTERGGTFASLIIERDEVSLAVAEQIWRTSSLRRRARAEDGPFRVITLDIDIDLNVCGYLAPAAVRLGEAGVAIVPCGAYLKDHLLVHERDLATAVRVLEEFIAESKEKDDWVRR
ncbi:MAG: hypothetical protein M3Z66_04490 [Chloroflexota bacterium]|nr:hypothetical protein [Chloroflexota bacterium]